MSEENNIGDSPSLPSGEESHDRGRTPTLGESPSAPGGEGNAEAAPARSNEGWDEPAWEALLSYVESKTVIPIIGRDLLQIKCSNGTTESLHTFLARRLVAKLRAANPHASIPHPEPTRLSDAVCVWMRAGRSPREVALIIRKLIEETKDVEWETPEPLRQLAEITDFTLLVSTTFDSLLFQAVSQTEIEGVRRYPRALAFDHSPLQNQAIEDLEPNDKLLPEKPVIYHLMGKLDGGPGNVVLTDHDLLEFVCALYSDNRKKVPVNLLNVFAKKHLLLLGCNFSDWLARFFLRMIRRRSTSGQQDGQSMGMMFEYVVDDYVPDDQNLIVFLEQFRPGTRIYRSGNVCEFVGKLHELWVKRNEGKRALIPDFKSDPGPVEEVRTPVAPKDSIFISYTRADEAAVRRLEKALRRSGFPVWYDRKTLEIADDWEAKIERGIQSCRIFLAVISSNTNKRKEGFFRNEWRQAIRRADFMSSDTRFIVPVAIEKLEVGTARVPKDFLRANWAEALDGHPEPGFLNQLRKIYDDAALS